MRAQSEDGQTVLCSVCQWLPPDRFYRRGRQSAKPRSACRDCTRRHTRRRAARKQNQRTSKALQKIIRSRADPWQWSAPPRRILRKMGGVRGFSARFFQLYEEARAAKRHHITLRVLLATMHLWLAGDQIQRSRRRQSIDSAMRNSSSGTSSPLFGPLRRIQPSPSACSET